MPNAQEIWSEIRQVTFYLIRAGLADEYNLPIRRNLGGGLNEVSFPKANRISEDLRGNPYDEVYQSWLRHRVFNVLIPSGGIIQLMYTFDRRVVASHRLAFYPSTRLDSVQGDVSTFDADEVRLLPTDRTGTPFPVRFDYNSNQPQQEETRHPMSHVTLGGYENCRIPVAAPVTPGLFIRFVLRNLLTQSDGHPYADATPLSAEPFDRTITLSELKELHIGAPARDR